MIQWQVYTWHNSLHYLQFEEWCTGCRREGGREPHVHMYEGMHMLGEIDKGGLERDEN